MVLNTLPYMHQGLDTPLRMHRELDTYFVGQSTVPFEHWFCLQTPRYHVISTQDAKTWARNAVTGNLMGYGRGPGCVNSAWVLRLQIAKTHVFALILILALILMCLVRRLKRDRHLQTAGVARTLASCG